LNFTFDLQVSFAFSFNYVPQPFDAMTSVAHLTGVQYFPSLSPMYRDFPFAPTTNNSRPKGLVCSDPESLFQDHNKPTKNPLRALSVLAVQYFIWLSPMYRDFRFAPTIINSQYSIPMRPPSKLVFDNWLYF
jgi:hypothetical protein